MFDRSRRPLFGAAEGGSGGESLPRFTPLPGGFGRRQTPVGEAGAPRAAEGAASRLVQDNAPTGAPAAGTAKAADNQDAQRRTAEAPSANAPSVTAPSATAPSATAGAARGPGDVATALESWLTREFRHLREAQCETMLSTIGALTGFAAQHGIWEAMVKPGRMAIQEAFVVIETRSGETFFFGDLLNNLLAAPDAAPSVWKIIGGAARALGAAELPDVLAIFKHCAETVGTGGFGLPQLADGHLPAIMPREALNRYWPEARRILAANRDPMSWAMDAATAAQQMMLGMKDRIDPLLAAQVVMEAAVPMSRVDPMTVPRD